MGLRFDLSTANWVAYVISSSARVPRLAEPWMEADAARRFLFHLRDRYVSTPEASSALGEIAHRALTRLDSLSLRDDRLPVPVLAELREYFGNRPWTALLVPSGTDPDLDSFLSSPDLLRTLVAVRPEAPGLILQAEESGHGPLALTDVFPAFRTALADPTRWPGILIWNRHARGQFLPFDTSDPVEIIKRAQWIISALADGFVPDFRSLRQRYEQEVLGPSAPTIRRLHVLHLSDLHIGSEVAALRLPRVQQLVRNIVRDLRETGEVIVIVSGDLMDSPNSGFLDQVRVFLDSLSSLTGRPAVFVLGNHDVRVRGILGERFKAALAIPGAQSGVYWVDDAKIGIVRINSVVRGRLATGYVGERQLLDLANEIDANTATADWPLIAVLHHHPIPIERPDWYVQPFYERVFGRQFERTDALHDSKQVLDFLENGRFCAVLHGHKHIPNIGETPDLKIPIFGCGSTVGKVNTLDGRAFMSANVVSLDLTRRRLSGRLLAERIAGTGFRPLESHQVVHVAGF